MRDPSATAPGDGRRVLIAFIVACAFLMQGIDSTLLTIAIPTIGRALSVDPLLLHLAITGYLVSLAVFMPVSGWFADRYGARKVFCAALVVFTLGSAVAAAAPDLPLMVAARIVQGFGGALMTPVGRLVVLRAFGPGRTLDAMTYLTLPVLIGPLLGPLIGAIIISHASWRWIFLVNVPVCAITLALTLRFVPRDLPAGVQTTFDTSGFLLAGSSLVVFQLGVEHLGHPLLGWPGTLGLFTLSVLLFLIYANRSRRRANPALDLSLFSTRAFAVGVVAGGVGRVGLNASAFLLPLLLQIGFGMAPIVAAAYSALSALGAVVAKPALSRSIAAFGYLPTLLALVVSGSALLGSFALMNADVPVGLLIAATLALGAVRTMHFNAVNTLTYSDVPGAMLSRSVSSAGVFQQLSMGLGVSVSAAALSLMVPEGVLPTVADFRLVFLLMAIVPLISVPVLLTLRRDDGQGHRATGHTLDKPA